MQVTDLRSGQSRRIDFPEPAYVASAYVNKEYDTSKLRYSYQSFITPQSIFEYDMEKRPPPPCSSRRKSPAAMTALATRWSGCTLRPRVAWMSPFP